jgi:hypothetical protein
LRMMACMVIGFLGTTQRSDLHGASRITATLTHVLLSTGRLLIMHEQGKRLRRLTNGPTRGISRR